MRKAHREAAKALYEDRNQHLTNHNTSLAAPNTDFTSSSSPEFYIDLHGLHPEEAVDYLDNVLTSHARRSGSGSGNDNGSITRHIVYAITGTGHHSKNGKDKVGKAVRNWLHELGYLFREFSVPGERGGYIGGVLGIEATSGGRGRSTTAGGAVGGGDESVGSSGGGPVPMVGGKIQVLKREEISTS